MWKWSFFLKLLVIVVGHVENFHGDGKKKGMFVFILLSLLLRTSLPAPGANWKAKLWFQHLNHCNPYKLPAGISRISITSREFKLCWLQRCQKCPQAPSQSSAVSMPHFFGKQFCNLFQAVLKATKGFKPSLQDLFQWQESGKFKGVRWNCSLSGDQNMKFSSWKQLSIPHSPLTSIYAGSVPAAEMLGCQSLGDLERYFESVTTHLSLGQPGGNN